MRLMLVIAVAVVAAYTLVMYKFRAFDDALCALRHQVSQRATGGDVEQKMGLIQKRARAEIARETDERFQALDGRVSALEDARCRLDGRGAPLCESRVSAPAAGDAPPETLPGTLQDTPLDTPERSAR